MRLILLTSLMAIVASLAQADPPENVAGEQPATEKPGTAKSEAKSSRSKSDRAAAANAAEQRRAAQREAAQNKKQALMAKTPVTPAREDLALSFAKKHHRELAGILQSLKSMEQTHYKTAIWEVARDAERLDRLQQRKDERYEPSLRIWKLDSRIRLEAARFSMNQSEGTEKKLSQLMLARRKAKVAFLKIDRKRSQSRTDRLDEQIESISSDHEQAVAAEIDRLRRSLAARGRSGAQSAVPRTKKTAAKSTASEAAVRNASATRTIPTPKEDSVAKPRSKSSPR